MAPAKFAVRRVLCTILAEDEPEAAPTMASKPGLRDATNKAAQSFDAFFDSVGASEIELAMDAVRRRDRVREIVPLRDG